MRGDLGSESWILEGLMFSCAIRNIIQIGSQWYANTMCLFMLRDAYLDVAMQASYDEACLFPMGIPFNFGYSTLFIKRGVRLTRGRENYSL